jgi:hypothetical protein
MNVRSEGTKQLLDTDWIAKVLTYQGYTLHVTNEMLDMKTKHILH